MQVVPPATAPDKGRRRRRLQTTPRGVVWGRFLCPHTDEGSEMETMNGAGAATTAELRQKVLRDVAQAEIKFVRLWFTDVVGRLKSFAITRDELEAALEH